MPLELAPLPVVCEMQADESGYGFLLRSAYANGISVAKLIELAGVRRPTWPLPHELERLAQLASVLPHQLTQAMKVRQSTLGRREFTFVNHRWMSVTALRARALQVCPSCLQERGYCRAIWELVGFSVCTRHGCHLVDRCMHCGAGIGWLRPAIDLCRCGRFYASGPPTIEGADAVIGWTNWLESQCSPGQAESLVFYAGQRDWWLQAEPDTAFHLLQAFGVRRDAVHHRSQEDTVLIPRTLEVTESLERGLARLRCVEPDAERLSSELVRVIDVPRLERLSKFGVTEAGRQTARLLLRRMRRIRPGAALRRRKGVAPAFKGQLDLFSDGDVRPL